MTNNSFVAEVTFNIPNIYCFFYPAQTFSFCYFCHAKSEHYYTTTSITKLQDQYFFFEINKIMRSFIIY